MTLEYLKIPDLDVICRLCQCSRTEMLNIFEHEYDGLHLTTKIMACAAITVYKGDGLPPQICNDCMQNVNSFFTFKQTCERSDAHLRRHLRQRHPVSQDDLPEDMSVKIELPNVKDEEEDDDSPFHLLSHEFPDGIVETVLGDMACSNHILVTEEMVGQEDHCRPDSPLNLTVSPKCSKMLQEYRPAMVEKEKPSAKMEAATSVASDSRCVPLPGEYEGLLSKLVETMYSPSKSVLFEKSATAQASDSRCVPLPGNYEGLLGKLVETMYSPGRSVLFEKSANAGMPIQPCELSMMSSLLFYQTLASSFNDKPFGCHLCGKAFRKKAGLSDHVRAHINRKAYKCRYCWKSYAQRAGLRSHERIHEGTQAFVCRVCQKAFTQRSHLVEHHRIHTGERPYACRACNRTFAKSWNLKCHEKSHCLLQMEESESETLNTCWSSASC